MKYCCSLMRLHLRIREMKKRDAVDYCPKQKERSRSRSFTIHDLDNYHQAPFVFVVSEAICIYGKCFGIVRKRVGRTLRPQYVT